MYDNSGQAVADYLTTADEVIDPTQPVPYIDAKVSWNSGEYKGCTFKELQVPIFKDGELVYKCPTIKEIRDYVRYQLDNEIWEEEQRFINPHTHYFAMSPAMRELKMELLQKGKRCM